MIKHLKKFSACLPPFSLLNVFEYLQSHPKRAHIHNYVAHSYYIVCTSSSSSLQICYSICACRFLLRSPKIVKVPCVINKYFLIIVIFFTLDSDMHASTYTDRQTITLVQFMRSSHSPVCEPFKCVQ